MSDYNSEEKRFGIPQMNAEIEAQADRIEALEARVAAADKLAEALEPFAEAADESDEWPLDDENQAPVDVGQCRAARTALAAYEATKEQSDG